MGVNTMRILKILRHSAIYIIFISLIITSSNVTPFYNIKYNLKSFLQPYLVKDNENQFFPKIESLNQELDYQSYTNEIFGISQDGEIVNDSFANTFSLINPDIVLDNNLTGKNTTIVILDTGVNINPWLKLSNLIGNYTTIPNSTIFNDDNGHGTFVASIISKIAPDSKLISIKVADSEGNSQNSWIESGFQLALNLNPTIIHASLGTTDFDSLNTNLLDEIAGNNISMVFSAGNNGPYSTSIMSPSIYLSSIAVGMAYNKTHVVPSSSSGPRPNGVLGPDLVAPGYNITGYTNEEEVSMRSGSSFASAFVTGSIALLKEKFPNEKPEIIKAALLETAAFINYTSPVQQGNGFLDISRAFIRLQNIELEPLFAFLPSHISSSYFYYGTGINGNEEHYKICLYSSINSTLKIINSSLIHPIDLIIDKLPQNISYGINILNITLKIPDSLPMDLRRGNVSFTFVNEITNQTLKTANISVSIDNRYAGGNILFFQGRDNDSFIPSGPTGSYSHLKQFLQEYYGMRVSGAIKDSMGLSIGGPLINTKEISGELTKQDLEGHDILVLADIELGMSSYEMSLIQEWVSEGHALLVLSYPSLIENGKELLSNLTTINELLQPYGIIIQNDQTKPFFSRFKGGKISISEPIFEPNFKNIEFDYKGTSLIFSSNSTAKPFATSINANSNDPESVLAAYWEDPISHGKIVVFGSETPFNNPNFYSSKTRENLIVITRIFRWLIQDQQIPLELLLTSTPLRGSSTKIQINVNFAQFNNSYFNGTIIEANGTYTQIIFNKSVNTYVGSWKPLVTGQAFLWLDLKTPGKTSTNGIFILEVISNTSSNFFMIILFMGLLVFGISYYLYASRQAQKRSPIEDRVTYEFRKQKVPQKISRLETLEKCPRCQTLRYKNGSKYCYQCGKEL